MPEPAPLGRRAEEAPQNAVGSTNPAAWIATTWPSAAPEHRHSRRVALLKRILPVIGVALLLLIAVWPQLAPLWERMRLVFPAIDLREARQLRMVNPHYAGLDRMGRPYQVTAAAGRQVPDRHDLMSLDAPRADMKTHAGGDIVVTAATGIYQSQAQILDLFGDVTLVDPNGARFVTDTARVDVANNAADGADPIEGHGPAGDLIAQGFRIRDKGDTIIFTGNSDLLMKQARSGTGKSVPAALPPAVATTAARVEAEAKPELAAVPTAGRNAAKTPAVTPAATRHPPSANRPLPGKTTPGKKI